MGKGYKRIVNAFQRNITKMAEKNGGIKRKGGIKRGRKGGTKRERKGGIK